MPNTVERVKMDILGWSWVTNRGLLKRWWSLNWWYLQTLTLYKWVTIQVNCTQLFVHDLLTSSSNNEQFILIILKRSLLNYQKIVRKCFLVTGANYNVSWWNDAMEISTSRLHRFYNDHNIYIKHRKHFFKIFLKVRFGITSKSSFFDSTRISEKDMVTI